MATSTLGSGTLVLAGTTSGTTTVTATAVAGTTTLTLPAATDTLVGKATTDTLTNKTLTTPSVSSPTISDGTANGVAYLNGSKVLTTGSALTFDGTTFIATGAARIKAVSSGDQLRIEPQAANSGVDILVRNSADNDLKPLNIYGSTQTWYVSGGARAMDLTSTGLGIGTTSPTAKLHISVASAVVDGTKGVKITNPGGTAVMFECGVSGDSFIGTTSGSDFNIRTGNTVRATFDNAGNLLVGTTSANPSAHHVLQYSDTAKFAAAVVNSSASTSALGLYIQYSALAPNSSASEFLYCGDTVGQKMSVKSNGGIYNFSANDSNLSDRREKTNFAPSKSYLDVICAIPVQTFNYIDQNMEDDAGLTLGVVAQDVQAVAPELVTETNWAGKDEEPKMRLSIYQTDLQYALMKCIQEQQALITQLTARITALEAT